MINTNMNMEKKGNFEYKSPFDIIIPRPIPFICKYAHDVRITFSMSWTHVYFNLDN